MGRKRTSKKIRIIQKHARAIDNQSQSQGTSTSTSSNEPSSSNFFVPLPSTMAGEARVPPLPELPNLDDYADPRAAWLNEKLKALKETEKNNPKGVSTQMKSVLSEAPATTAGEKQLPGIQSTCRLPAGTTLTTNTISPICHQHAIFSLPAASTVTLPKVPPPASDQGTSDESADITSTTISIPVADSHSYDSSSIHSSVSSSGARAIARLHRLPDDRCLGSLDTLSSSDGNNLPEETAGSDNADLNTDFSPNRPLLSHVFAAASEKCKTKSVDAGECSSFQAAEHIDDANKLKTKKEVASASAKADNIVTDILAEALKCIQVGDVGGVDTLFEGAGVSITSSASEEPLVFDVAELSAKEKDEKSAPAVLGKPPLAFEERTVVTATENAKDTTDEIVRERNKCVSALTAMNKCIAEAENLKKKLASGKYASAFKIGGSSSSSGDPPSIIPSHSLLAIELIPIVNVMKNTAERVQNALGNTPFIDVEAANASAAAELEINSANTCRNDGKIGEQQNASTHLTSTLRSRTERGDILVGDSRQNTINTLKKPGINPKTTCSATERNVILIENVLLPPVLSVQDVADEQQKASIVSTAQSSQVESGDIPVEEVSSLKHSDHGAGEEHQDPSTRFGTENSGADVESEDDSAGIVSVEVSEDSDEFTPTSENSEIAVSLLNNDVRKTHYVNVNFTRSVVEDRMRPTIYSCKENMFEAVLEGELLENSEEHPVQLEIDLDERPEDVSADIDNVAAPEHHCPARTYCLESCRLRSHLATCFEPFCKEKYCWQLTQVINHWIHCVEKNCQVCPPRENDEEEVSEEAEWLNKVVQKEDIENQLLMEYQLSSSLSSELSEYLTAEGQNVILAYYVQYFYDAFVAYNYLLHESEKRTMYSAEMELPPKEFIETVRHSSNCLPMNNCRLNQCQRLRMVIAHWSKWNCLCYWPDCRLCTHMRRRLKKGKSNISHIIEFLNTNKSPTRSEILMNHLIQMVRQTDEKTSIKSKLKWANSSRINFRNVCVNNCIFYDKMYDEFDSNKDENFDLESLFDKCLTFQLLTLSRNLIYRAISLKEHELFIESENLATYYAESMGCGVRLMRAVHTLAKRELSLFDDSWEHGNDIIGHHIPPNRRHLMQLGFKMENKLKEFGESM